MWKSWFIGILWVREEFGIYLVRRVFKSRIILWLGI